MFHMEVSFSMKQNIIAKYHQATNNPTICRQIVMCAVFWKLFCFMDYAKVFFTLSCLSLLNFTLIHISKIYDVQSKLFPQRILTFFLFNTLGCKFLSCMQNLPSLCLLFRIKSASLNHKGNNNTATLKLEPTKLFKLQGFRKFLNKLCTEHT